MTAWRFKRREVPARFLEQVWRMKASLLAERWGLSVKAIEAWRRRLRKRGRAPERPLTPRQYRDQEDAG